MKIIVIGLGSMGRRRARLLQRIGDNEIVGVDLSDERRENAEDELGIITYGTLEDAMRDESVEAAVICTPPLSHASFVEKCLDCGLHVFTELNLVKDGYEENGAKARENGLVWFPSSTFLYRKEIEKIKELIGVKPMGAWTYHVGQYLPDWHPWESYQDFFVADARTSGVRELLAIELPWLVDIFGPIKETRCFTQKISALDLPYQDTIIVAVEHKGGTIGALLVDVVCRTAVRDFSFTSEDCYIRWDGSPTGLRVLDIASQKMMDVDVYGSDGAEQRGEYARFIVEDAYASELMAFVEAVEHGASLRWTLEEDGRILGIIDDLENGR